MFSACVAEGTAGGNDTPPELEKGWNLVSAPCSFQKNSLSRSLLKTMSYFTWDGEKYIEVSGFERGRGYVVNSKSVVNISSMCPGNTIQPPIEIELTEGWNLIGNPYHKSVAVAELFDGVQDEITSIFEYRGNRFVELGPDGHLKPWRGYWVYVKSEVSINTAEQCSFEIRASRSPEGGAPAVAVEEIRLDRDNMLYLYAFDLCTLGDQRQETEVTEQVTWTVSEPGIGFFDGTVFTARTEGSALIEAHLNSDTSLPLKVVVDDVDLEKCSELRIVSHAVSFQEGDFSGFMFSGEAAAERTDELCFECSGQISCGYPENESGYLTFRPGMYPGLGAYCRVETSTGSYWRDVTDDVAWSAGEGTISINRYNRVDLIEESQVEITATYHEKKSTSVPVRMISSAIDTISIIAPGDALLCDGENERFCDGEDLLVLGGETIMFSGVGSYRKDGEYFACGEGGMETAEVDLDSYLLPPSAWLAYADGVVMNIEGAAYTATGEGFYRAAAVVDEVSSNKLSVRVIDGNTPVSITISPGGPVELMSAQKVRLKVVAQLFTAGNSRDVTDEVEWEVEASADGVGTITDGIFFAGKTSGAATVTARLGSLTTQGVWIEVEEPVKCDSVEYEAVFAPADSADETIPVSPQLVIFDNESGKLEVTRICAIGDEVRRDDVTDSVAWELTGDDVLEISSSGGISAKGVGEAKLSGSVDGAPITEIAIKTIPYCEKIMIVEKPYKSILSISSEDGEGFNFRSRESGEPISTNCFSCDMQKVYCYSYSTPWSDKGMDVELAAVCLSGNEPRKNIDANNYIYSLDAASSRDVTGQVVWETEDDEIVENMGGAVFSGKKEGHTVVKASYYGRLESQIDMTILSSRYGGISVSSSVITKQFESGYRYYTNPMMLGDVLQLTATSEIRSPVSGSTAVCTEDGEFSSSDRSARIDVTDEVEWVESREGPVENLGGGAFKGLLSDRDGTSVSIKLSLQGSTAGTGISILRDSFFPYINVEPYMEQTVYTGDEIDFSAMYYRGIESVDDIGKTAEWRIEAEGYSDAKIENGKFKAGMATGTVYVNVVHGGVTSYSTRVDILARHRLHRVDIFIENPTDGKANRSNVYMKPGSSVQLRAYGVFEAWETDSINPSYSKIDITDEIDWKNEVQVDQGLTITPTGQATLETTEISRHAIWIKYRGIQSNNIYVYPNSDVYPVVFKGIPFDSIALGGGSSVTLKAIAAFSRKDICFDTFDSDNPDRVTDCDYRVETVTNETSYTFSFNYTPPDDSLTVRDGILYAGNSPYSGHLIATYMGKVDKKSLFVWVGNMYMLEALLPRERVFRCPAGECYLMKVGETRPVTLVGHTTISLTLREYILNDGVEWEVSDTSIATVSNGEVTAHKPGVVWIRGNYKESRSDMAPVLIYDDDHKDFLVAGVTTGLNAKRNKPLKAGEILKFKAMTFSVDSDYRSGSYEIRKEKPDLGVYVYGTNVTPEAEWISSDISKASFSQYTKGVLNGSMPGFTSVNATYDGMTSLATTVEVWDFHNVYFCDPDNPNRGEWDSEHSHAILETDCRVYSQDEKVGLRYTALVDGGLEQFMDNCLDLFVLDADDNVVKQLRDEGCSTEKVGRSMSRGLEQAYQFFEEWDQTDESGNRVAPGRYYVVARFYILWDPLIKIPIDIVE